MIGASTLLNNWSGLLLFAGMAWAGDFSTANKSLNSNNTRLDDEKKLVDEDEKKRYKHSLTTRVTPNHHLKTECPYKNVSDFLRVLRTHFALTDEAERLLEELLCMFYEPQNLKQEVFGSGTCSILEHHLQMSHHFHHSHHVPEHIRDEFVVMTLFHDLFYVQSPSHHGHMLAHKIHHLFHHSEVLHFVSQHTKFTRTNSVRALQKEFFKMDSKLTKPTHHWIPAEAFVHSVGKVFQAI